MTSLLNKSRPPVFCPGCGHEIVVRALDKAFQNMGLEGNRICLVSDIGCSGLFDTFFNTHALHGLHGRVLTYAAGIKLCRPELQVVATMGDGGLGIGGAHLLAACRRNVNITLLVLNNFNFGMTGGQCSSTTPSEAEVASGFLNRLDRPLDLHSVATAAGAPYVASVSGYQKGLDKTIEEAIVFDGFSIVEILGICPGRYTKRNKLTPGMIEADLARNGQANGPVPTNTRPEYGRAYRELARQQVRAKAPIAIEAALKPAGEGRQDVIILGSAGQRVITAGELLGMAAMSAGLYVTQKNDYDITVLRGPSITELILSPAEIDYPEIGLPSVILALAPEGVARRKNVFAGADESTLVIQASGVAIPETKAKVREVDFKALGLKGQDWAVAALAVIAKMQTVIDEPMLESALAYRFGGKVLASVKTVVETVMAQTS
ncbi:MAG: 2-oxoacid:acceptor oxidoreductase family protein [Desulfomonile tiedjei]|nr:2-oxoacid:acceptor oxidoreductase family protein [Desulfomonile tiedjei]